MLRGIAQYVIGILQSHMSKWFLCIIINLHIKKFIKHILDFSLKLLILSYRTLLVRPSKFPQSESLFANKYFKALTIHQLFFRQDSVSVKISSHQNFVLYSSIILLLACLSNQWSMNS